MNEIKRLKILIFSIAYFPHVGGAEVAIREITDRIRDMEFDMVTLRLDKNDARPDSPDGEIDGGQAKSERIGNVNVYRIDCPKVLFPFYAAKKGKELHGAREYGVVWSMMANLAGLAGLLLRSMLRNKLRNKPRLRQGFGGQAKFLLTLQTGNDDKKVWKRTWWWRPIYKMIYRKADYIQAISNYLGERARKMKVKCPIDLIPNGVDLTKFYPADNRLQIRSELGIPNITSDDKIVITTSRLVEKNGVEYLIRAMVDTYTNTKLLILGSGELEGQLKSLTKELGLENRVIFLGQVDYDNIPKYLRASDVFCRPSLSEGLGSSFLEAMACGLPIIGTRVGGIPDILSDGINGLYCEVKNPESINDKIKMLLNNKQLHEKLSSAAAKHVQGIYNWEYIAIEMSEIFKKLV